MTQQSDVQLAQLLRNAGVPTDQIPTMVAIALAESRGNDMAIGDVNLQTSFWGPSVGLWQIRSVISETGTGSTRDKIANLAPQTNANHANDILKSQGLGAWSTYTNGAYRMFLARGQAAASGVNSASGTDNGGGGGGGIPGVSELVKIFQTLANPHTYVRFSIVVAGAILLFIGIWLLIQNEAFKFGKPLAEKVL